MAVVCLKGWSVTVLAGELPERQAGDRLTEWEGQWLMAFVLGCLDQGPAPAARQSFAVEIEIQSEHQDGFENMAGVSTGRSRGPWEGDPVSLAIRRLQDNAPYTGYICASDSHIHAGQRIPDIQEGR